MRTDTSNLHLEYINILMWQADKDKASVKRQKLSQTSAYRNSA